MGHLARMQTLPNKHHVTYLYACWINADEAPAGKYQNGTPKGARKVINIGKHWKPVCFHGNRIVKLILSVAHLVASYRKDSKVLIQFG